MDPETQRIMQRTLERKKELEDQMKEFANYFPHVDSETESSAAGVKRKSSSTTNDENQMPDNHSPTKKGSFGEKDRQTSGSLYPVNALDEMKKSPLHTSDEPVFVRSAHHSLTELQPEESPTKQAREATRKAKFAALAAQTDDFECELKPSACQRPKSEFMRGAAPKTLADLRSSPANSSSDERRSSNRYTVQASRAEETTTTDCSTTSSPVMVRQTVNRQHVGVRFDSPIAQIAMSFDSSMANTTTTDDDAYNTEAKPNAADDNCRFDFIDQDTEDRIDEIAKGAKIAMCADEKQRGETTTVTPPKPKRTYEYPGENTGCATDSPLVGLPSQSSQKSEAIRVFESLPIKPSQKSEAIRAFESLIEHSSPCVSRAVTGSSTLQGRLLSSVSTAPVRQFLSTPKSVTTDPKPSESSTVLTESQDVKRLRNRWEVSSKTGTPLHPDKDGDELLEAATKMAQAPYRKSIHCVPKRLVPEDNKKAAENSNAAPVPLDDPVESSEDSDAIDCGKEADYEIVTPASEEDDDDSCEIEAEHVADAAEVIDQVFRDSLGDEDDSVLSNDRSAELVSTSNARSPLSPHRARQAEAAKPDVTDDQESALVHSVSFYRRQQRVQRTTVASTPVVFATPTNVSPSKRQSAAVRSEADDRRHGRHVCEQKIQLLNEAINIQQEQIAQASRALKYCHDKPEFRGGREEMDAQRALLLANERRKALFAEFDRMKTIIQTKDYSRLNLDGPCGTLTVSHITIRLARDFINEYVNKTEGDLLYYFLVLLKHKDVVHSTQMVTSDEGLRQGNLEIPHYLQLTGLQHDFAVTMEVYSLKTRREVYTHAEKYQLPGTKGFTLRKKNKSTGGLFSHVGFSSPDLQMAVLDPGFQRIAQLNLNLNAVNRGKFMLDRCEYPLDGSVFVNLRCYADSAGSVEHRGFLSMYQKVSGLGSWTRYWCLLKDGQINFWRYPDDEPIKAPVATVDLSRSVSEAVEMTHIEDCGARPHTFRLDVFREVPSKDRRRDIVRILLSADSRADCSVWCDKMNHTLRDLHLWNPDHSNL